MSSKIAFPEKQIATLMKLGIPRTQAILYLTSLKHGILSVLELARLTGISRPQIYEDANALLEIGLYETTAKRRRKYIAAQPSKLIRVGKSRLSDMEDMVTTITALVPTLETSATTKKNKVNVKYFEGISQMKEAFEAHLEAFKNTDGFSITGLYEEIVKYLPESYWWEWDRRFAKQNSTYRLLCDKSEVSTKFAKTDKLYHREHRYLDNFPLKSNIEVFGNVVMIISWQDELAIWIESPILAESYRSMFEVLWAQSKRFE